MSYNVNFLEGTQAQYDALQSKDSGTFYKTSGGNVYLGDIKLSNELIAGDNITIDPTTRIISASGNPPYSTQETEVGTWIDGKKVYQKTIKVYQDQLTSNIYKLIDGSNETIERIIKADIIASKNGVEFVGPYWFTGDANNALPYTSTASPDSSFDEVLRKKCGWADSQANMGAFSLNWGFTGIEWISIPGKMKWYSTVIRTKCPDFPGQSYTVRCIYLVANQPYKLLTSDSYINVNAAVNGVYLYKYGGAYNTYGQIIDSYRSSNTTMLSITGTHYGEFPNWKDYDYSQYMPYYSYSAQTFLQIKENEFQAGLQTDFNSPTLPSWAVDMRTHELDSSGEPTILVNDSMDIGSHFCRVIHPRSGYLDNSVVLHTSDAFDYVVVTLQYTK